MRTHEVLLLVVRLLTLPSLLAFLPAGQFPEAVNRLPAKQILIEMTTLIKQRIQEATNTDVRCQVRTLPKFDPHYKMGEAPHTEILVLEADKKRELDRYVQFDQCVLKSGTSGWDLHLQPLCLPVPISIRLRRISSRSEGNSATRTAGAAANLSVGPPPTFLLIPTS